MRSGVSDRDTRVAMRSPAWRPSGESGPTSSTTPTSMPPEPVTGFCILPRAATIASTSARSGVPVPRVLLGELAEARRVQVEPLDADPHLVRGELGVRVEAPGRLREDAGRLEDAVQADRGRHGADRPICGGSSRERRRTRKISRPGRTTAGRYPRTLAAMTSSSTGQPYAYAVATRWSRTGPGSRAGRRDRRPVARRPVAALALREEPEAAARPHGRPARGPVLRRPRARPGRAGDHVDARAAADDEHDGPGVARRGDTDPARSSRTRSTPTRSAATCCRSSRPPYRLAVAPARDARLAARARHVGRRGPHAPLPDQGARRAAADLPAVLRPLHADGHRRQLDPAGGQAEVRPQAGGPLRPHDRLPAPYPWRARRRRLRRRRRQPAVEEPRVVRGPAARDREHPRHPARDQGPHGPPPALAAGRGRSGHEATVHRARARGRRSRSTPT